MKRYRMTMAVCALLIAAGCATTGVVQPSGFRQEAAYAEATHTAVIDALDSSVNAHTISSDDAASIAVKAAQAQAVLQAAVTAYTAGDTAGANARLATALTALQALQDYLRAHGSKP